MSYLVISKLRHEHSHTWHRMPSLRPGVIKQDQAQSLFTLLEPAAGPGTSCSGNTLHQSSKLQAAKHQSVDLIRVMLGHISSVLWLRTGVQYLNTARVLVVHSVPLSYLDWLKKQQQATAGKIIRDTLSFLQLCSYQWLATELVSILVQLYRSWTSGPR